MGDIVIHRVEGRGLGKSLKKFQVVQFSINIRKILAKI